MYIVMSHYHIIACPQTRDDHSGQEDGQGGQDGGQHGVSGGHSQRRLQEEGGRSLLKSRSPKSPKKPQPKSMPN